jgi:hypothetical protein
VQCTKLPGIGGLYASGHYAKYARDENLAHVPAGGTLWTFKLLED